MAPVPPAVRPICPTVLRSEFNSREIHARADAGEFTTRVREYLAPAKAGQVPGALSQYIYYFEGETMIAQAHCYREPGGKIGASGRPDPKWLLVEGEALIPDPDSAHSCPSCRA